MERRQFHQFIAQLEKLTRRQREKLLAVLNAGLKGEKAAQSAESRTSKSAC
jgi:hypothetical protein